MKLANNRNYGLRSEREKTCTNLLLMVVTGRQLREDKPHTSRQTVSKSVTSVKKKKMKKAKVNDLIYLVGERKK